MQLGKAIGILVAAVELENAYHEDVAAMNAPSECHDVVSRGEAQRMRHARRRALHAAGLNRWRLLRRAVRKQTGNDKFFYKRYGFVPY